MKILCLGNEFIGCDSFAKDVGKELGKKGFEIVSIKDSFELLNYIDSEEGMVILDVVEGLKEVKLLKIGDLKESKIMSAHDFDAGFFLKLIGGGKGIRIVGIPMEGDVEVVSERVKELLKPLHP